MSENGDIYVELVERALAPYKAGHPAADIKVRRYESVAIQIRIIDPAFRGRGLAQREDEVWPLIQSLPGDVREEITMLLLVAPEEMNPILEQEFSQSSVAPVA